MHKWKW